MLHAVILDMDGTLLDSEPIHAESFNGFLNKLGVTERLDVEKDVVGYDLETICKNCIERFGLAIEAEDYKRGQHDYTLELFSTIDLKETAGLTPFLKELKSAGIHTAVASATQGDIVEVILNRMRIRSYIDEICGFESVQHMKPAPDIFLLAAQRLGTAPEDCLVIEDSPAGILAAQAAGMKSIAIYCNTKTPEQAGSADLIVNDFRELDLSVIRQLSE